jgi:hypothetical protein
MTPTKQQWLTTARARTKGNTSDKLSQWVIAMIEAADIPEESKSVVTRIAMESMMAGGWRGNISEAWIAAGFTDAQFNFELIL